MRTRITLALKFLFAVCVFSESLSAQHLLRWKFSAGNEWLVRMDQTTTWQSTIAGKTSQTRVDCEMELAWTTEKVNDNGSAVIAQRFKRILVNRTSAKLPAIIYDSQASTKPSGDVKLIADSLSPLLSCVLRITLSPRGEIGNAELDTATTEALATNPGLKAFLTGEGLKTLLRNTDLLLPADEVKVGDTWQQTGSSETSLGPLQHTRKYELQTSDADKLAKIAVTTTFNLEKPKTEEAGKPVMKSHKQDGTFFFDHSAGRLQSSSVTQQLVTVSMHKETAVQVRLDSTMKMTLEAK